LNELKPHELVHVLPHTRKPAKARAHNSDPSKVATSATHALNREPDHDDRTKYASALAGVLRRWFGDEGLSVARELVRILEGGA